MIKNHERIGALANKYITITNYCKPGSIVFDVDADDEWIGRQLMKLMNTFYQASNKWFIYTNFVQHSENNIGIGFSTEIKKETLEANVYRTAPEWCTSHLKTYLRDLYVKIPKEYFIEEGKKFYFRVSDRFQMYALVELAGPKNIKFVPDLVYWYYWSSFSRATTPCFYEEVTYYEYVARKQTPLLPLNSLDDEARSTPNYVLPPNIKDSLQRSEKSYRLCRASVK